MTRGRRRSAGGAAAGAALLFLLAPLAASAEPWHAAYERGQVLLAAGDPAAAEAAFRRALSLRPRPGCRVRTYGLRVRDYAPWYYLAVALEDQGRGEEALAAHERSRAEGAVSACPGLQAQAADQRERIARLRPSPGGPSVDLETLQGAALDAGAGELAPELLLEARRLEAGCPPDCERAARAWLAALSRARVVAPLRSMLLEELALAADELRHERPDALAEPWTGAGAASLADALASAGEGEGGVPELLGLLGELESRLEKERSRAAAPPAAALPAAAARGESPCGAARRSVAAALAASEAAAAAGASVPAAAEALETARRLLEQASEPDCRRAVRLAEQARAAHARAVSSRALALRSLPALVELQWSRSGSGLPRALIGPGTEEPAP